MQTTHPLGGPLFVHMLFIYVTVFIKVCVFDFKELWADSAFELSCRQISR